MRICSDPEDRDKRLDKFKTWLFARNYPCDIIDSAKANQANKRPVPVLPYHMA